MVATRIDAGAQNYILPARRQEMTDRKPYCKSEMVEQLIGKCPLEYSDVHGKNRDIICHVSNFCPKPSSQSSI
jgi:hypothetical protein